MTQRASVVFTGNVLAALFIFAAPPQGTPAKLENKALEAARLNNLGAAYMNQQLFEKGLKAFQEAAALDPKLQIARSNQGIALLNLGRIELAKQFLEEADRKSTRLNSSHLGISYAVFCLK